MYDRGIAAIENQSSSLLKINEQISAQRRILTPSDDPVAATQALGVSQTISINNQYMTNQKAAQNVLGLEDTTLKQVSDLLQHAHSLAVEAGNATYDNVNRGYLADQLRSDLQQLMSLANSTDGNGSYLFSGYQGKTVPFSTTSGASAPVQYNGDQGQRLLQVDSSRQIPISDSGYDVFMGIKNGNGTFVSAPATTNNGTGVIDTGNVLDPTKWNAAGLSQNYSVVFKSLPSSVTGTALGAGQEISISDPAAWTAAGKNVTVSFTATTYTVNNLNDGSVTGPISYAGTPISIQGAGLSFNFAPAAGSSYSVNGSSTTYDLIDNANPTVSLVTGAALPTTGAYSKTYTSGQSISFNGLSVPAAGSDYGVNVTVTGSPASGDRFTVKASTNESMFKTLDDLATQLSTGVRNGSNGDIDRATLSNAINKALSSLNNDIDQISTVRASVGARMSELDATNSMSQDLDTQYQKNLSTLQDLDFAKAVSDLDKSQVGLDAAQKAYTRVTGLSLFNYL